MRDGETESANADALTTAGPSSALAGRLMQRERELQSTKQEAARLKAYLGRVTEKVEQSAPVIARLRTEHGRATRA